MNNLSQNSITFLSDIDNSYRVIKSAKYHYINLGWGGWDRDLVEFFIKQIPDNCSVLIFPFISTSKSPDLPYLRLSRQFLINNNSNVLLIKIFLDSQWFDSEFYLPDEKRIYLYFKFKKVNIIPYEY